MTIKELVPTEFDPYYGRYINKLYQDISLRDSFIKGKEKVISFFKDLPETKYNFRYATGKWTCKEILQHLIDTERIFQYRCFRIARQDKTELAGFDQNIYVEPSTANTKTMDELIQEFVVVRDSSISLVNSLSDEDLKNVGNANGGNMSARAAAFTITGHEIWHMEIIIKRYL
ncbi:DinB family protein [Winogradskyella flava]|uniref:DinB family protein n=1 Tax=Winogradskyella flava TaxID=1884876 RepID=UPI00248FFD30|nr:DinB family protein [Winogradskyella flava]